MVENQALNLIGEELTQKLIKEVQRNPLESFASPIQYSNNDHISNNSTNSGLYEADRFPYDITQAKNHAMAKRVCKKRDEIQLQEGQIDQVCPCCQLPIENELLPICCNRNDFDDLGPGIPLYFETLIYCIIMLLIILLIQGLYSLISNYYTNDCLPENAENEAVCQRDFINIISISNKFRHHGLYKFQSFVNLVSMIVVIISLHYYRIFQKRSAEEIDRDNISPSDYTIMITGLPKGGYHEALVEKTVWEFWNRIPQEQGYANKEDVITKIVLAYDIVEFVSLSRERKKLFLEKRRFDHERKNHGKKTDELKIAEIQRKLNFIEDKIKKEEGDVESGIRNKTCGIAFVSFRTQKIRKEFMERVEIGVCQRIGDFIKEKVLFCWKLRLDRFHLFEDKNVRLKVQKAAEPDEIIWENLGYNEKYRRNARHKTHFLTTIVLCICFSVIFGISYLQEDLKINFSGERKMEKGLKFLSVVASFLIVFINTCLILQIRKFADMEKNLTTTEFYISVARKLTYAQFCNTALIVLLANLSILKYWKLFSQGGLISDLFMIFLSNAYIPPLMSIFDSFFFLKLFRKWKTERSLKKGHSITTQSEANELYEGPTIDMSSKYAALTKTMWLTSFYVCITPIGLIISILNLIIVYWIDKILLLRRYARPKVVSYELSKEMLGLIDYCPFFMAAGSLIFHHVLFDPSMEDQLPDIIAISIGCMNFIFPTSKIRSFFKKQSTGVIGEDKDYYQAQVENFSSNYDLANPVTRESVLNTINTSRLLKSSQRADEIIAKNDSIPYRNSLTNYANMGDIPKYQYKKSRSKKFQTNVELAPNYDKIYNLIETQNLNNQNQNFLGQNECSYDQNQPYYDRNINQGDNPFSNQTQN